MSSLSLFLVGLVLAALLSTTAYLVKVLTLSGAAAAFILGTVVFGLGGLPWALVLMMFFITSSGLSILFKKRKAAAEKMYAKGTSRDWGQVLANGGVAGIFVILHAVWPDSILPWAGFCAAFAAANADTWATELGVLNRRNPVLISTGKSVEPGTSGAVSLAGTLASAGGSLLISLTAWCVGTSSTQKIMIIAVIALAGFFGSLVDSFLGARWQAIYTCPKCAKETEKHPLHGCGTPTRLIRGLQWMNNDIVNFLCTLSGAGFAILIALFI